MNPINLGLLVITLWLVSLTLFLWQINRQNRRLTAGVSQKDLKSVLEATLAHIQQLQTDMNQLQKKQGTSQKQAEWHLQKIGFVRFNPFNDTGGDQSFCLVLLDRHDNGIMISSLHSREQTRVYAKRLVQGKTDGLALSREEQQAFEDAHRT